MPTDDTLDRQIMLDVLAAELKLEETDANSHVEGLAGRLSHLFPQHVTVSRESRPGLPQHLSIAVDLGGARLVLRTHDCQLIYESVLRVHGIDLSRQRLSQQAWLEQLTAAIVRHTETLRASEQLRDLL